MLTGYEKLKILFKDKEKLANILRHAGCPDSVANLNNHCESSGGSCKTCWMISLDDEYAGSINKRLPNE